MRTLSEGMIAHLAGSAHTLASMLRLVLQDGTALGFTNHDKPLMFDLGDDLTSPAEMEYEPWSGIDLSAIVLTTGLEASNFEVSGPVGPTVTANQVNGGRFRGATAHAFMVNWATLADGPIRLIKGTVGEGRVEGSRFILEVRGLAAPFNETWGRVISPYCSAVFGNSSTGCPVVRTPIAATVISVQDDFNFRVDLGGTYADDYFNLGGALFLTGPLANTAEAMIQDYEGDGGFIELVEPLVDTPEVGDTLNLFQGCSKLLRSDDPSLPTCLTHDAVLDFRGHPEAPGSRFYHRVSAPGASYA